MATEDQQFADMTPHIPERDLWGRMLHSSINPAGITEVERIRPYVAGKVILVTGASYGIGAATAYLLGQAGAKVLLVARSQDKLENVAEKINEAGGDAYVMATDLTDPVAVAGLAGTITEKFGAVDVLVNNAGKSIRRSIKLSMDRFQDFERTIDINYTGPVQLLLKLLPGMYERGSGQIINISTVGVRVPPGPRWGAYQASKGAFDILLRSLSIELKGAGIKTSTIYMPLVHTRMSAPTPVFRDMPGLSPREAAGLVARAIRTGEAGIAPWWLHPAEVLTTTLRNPTRALMSFLYKNSDDTESAKASLKAGEQNV